MRWVLRILGAVAVLVLIGIGVVMMIPTERVAGLAAAKFEEMTGRALTLEGDVSPSFWPVLGVTTGRVTIANADWATSGAPMLSAESLTIQINAAALFGGELRILGLTAQRPALVLERAKNGRENWVFNGGASAADNGAEPSGGTRSYTLEKGLIEGGSLRFVDHGTGQDLQLDAVDLELAVPDYTGPFTINATALIAGQSLAVTAEGGAFAAFTQGRLVPVKIAAAAGGSSLGFDGRAGWQPMAAEGALKLDLSDLGAVAALAGTSLSPPPPGMGAKELALTGQFTLDGSSKAYLRGASITADDNMLTGDLDIVLGEDRPKLSGNLRATALHFGSALSADAAGSGGTDQARDQSAAAAAANAWPKDKIDVSALGAMDASVTLVVDALDLGRIKTGPSRLVLKLERARAVFDIREMSAYGGSIKGEFVVNGRGGLSLGGKLSLANLQAQPLLQDLARWDRLMAAGNLTLSFLAVGNSVDELMRSLKGEGSLALGKGELRGLDIGGMLRTLDAGYVGEGQKTIFDGIAGSFTIAEGTLRNEDLRLIAPYLNATGAGRIGFGARDLDYRIRPTAFPGEGGTGGVMVPLRITGSWQDPTYRLDLESIAREKMEAEAKAAAERLKAEAAEAERRAKAALEAKLREELGVEAQEGERMEDAAKRRAREALGKEAGKLLEGLLGGD